MLELKKIFKWIILMICGIFIILGVIGIAMGITESWLTLILGSIPPLIYYGYMKEGSAGDKLIKKILNGKFGLILVITITVLYIISRIIMLLLD